MATVTTSAPPSTAAPVRIVRLGILQAVALPLTFIAALASVAFLPSISANANLRWSILGAAGALLIGLAALQWRVMGQVLTLDVQLRSQHYLQACAQSTVLLYWGYYWRPVYDALPLLVAQLLFAYAFDILLAWSRRNSYTFGFAPFPVIFSINLFLWFKPDWFYLQFLMIAVGFAAKELIRWNKDGRRTHIFNPSSFPLAVFSLGLILTDNTSITWGPEIARTQFNPPNIYLLLFLVGLPGQLLFGVTSMTMSAVVTTYLFGVVYYALTGAYFFVDAYVPIAVFLGMHLLFTDPSTSPKTELGRVLYGMLYGLGNVVLYEVLGRMGVPTFYDKLLPVPILNLMIKSIDGVARGSWLNRFDTARLGRGLSPRRRNLAWVTVWSGVFIGMSLTNAVGDSHPGHSVPFWQQACQKDARNACENLSVILDTYCEDGSGWACNEVGALRWHGRVANTEPAAANFVRACALGFNAGCENGVGIKFGAVVPQQSPPTLNDWPVVLRTGKGALPDREPVEFYTRACEQKWLTGCYDLAATYLAGKAAPRDPLRAAAAYETACSGGVANACSDLGLMYYSADGVPGDRARGLGYLKRACDLGSPRACRWLKDAAN
jgi:hypothetical protein